MENTWANRDFPVLDHIVKRLDDPEVDFVYVAETAEVLNLESDDVVSAFDALEGDGYITRAKGGAKINWAAMEVSGEARRKVGQWPTAEGTVDALIRAIELAAAQASSTEERTKLQKTAEGLRSFARDVAVGVVTRVLTGGLT
ncbi:hypothetical protein AB0M39_33330 [Streptomyces sp. NPDC051907]|uniref:hypothetical protein n=1 Tax=Streptomyces sp. NPDC051907 TaxID=3155284 RepID=UPI00342D40A2